MGLVVHKVEPGKVTIVFHRIPVFILDAVLVQHAYDAYVPIAEAMKNEYISDEDIKTMKDLPMYFIFASRLWLPGNQPPGRTRHHRPVRRLSDPSSP